MPVGRVPAAMASAMAGFSPASRARRRCAWNSYWAVHLRPAMMIASSLSRGEIELPNRTNAPTRWTRSHSSGLRKSALNGPRRPAPRGPDWMASATRFCSVVIVSAVSVVNRPSVIAMPPLRGRPWPPVRVDCSGRRERHRQPLDAADEVRAELLRLRRGLDVGQPAEQLDEHRGDLSTRQVRAQAEVGAARSEGALLVRRARDVEAVGVGEVLLVTVGGDVPHGDLLAPLQRHAGERRVARDGPPHVHHRAAHRMISSTAEALSPSRLASHFRFSWGNCVKAHMPRLMAVRV